MADFTPSFIHTINAEGGYVHDPDDPGGETYKGVARSRNPGWSGWSNIDRLKKKKNFPKNLDADSDLQEKVKALYKSNYWDKVKGDEINDQDIAESIYDFAVNAGPRTSAKLAQIAVQTVADGVIGPKTLEKINSIDKRTFLAVFALAKIQRYVEICEKRRTSRKYFFGWARRTLSVWDIIQDDSCSFSLSFSGPMEQQSDYFDEELEQLDYELLRASREFGVEEATTPQLDKECSFSINQPASKSNEVGLDAETAAALVQLAKAWVADQKKN
ncbi:MAG: hypothetical protein D3909_08900 [Candidatus Electrothrix sp. ATG1]|nr:hypothetical protein [Candidatus Electrothrix sp. ATG1]